MANLPPRPMLDVSHRVQTEATLDVSHHPQYEYTHEDDWERPSLGNECYDPVQMPQTPYEIEYHRVNYPFIPAYHRVYPMDSLIFKKMSDTQIGVLFVLQTNGNLYDFTIPTVESKNGMPEFLTMRQCREIQFYQRHQPYLGFIPRENVFEGPIFGRFHGNRSFFETKVKAQGPRLFIFDRALAESWIRVEEALMALMGLFHVTLRPLTAPRDSYPSDTRFFDPKPSVKKVVDSVLFAQKLILQLIAELRYSIAVSVHSRDTNWLPVLNKFPFSKDFDHSWLADLAISKAMTTKRLAGTIIHASQIEKGYNAHRFAHFDVPVYIPFAIINCKIKRPGTRYRPVEHEQEVKFEASITQDQLKHMWLPFNLGTVKRRIELEWEQHYRAIFLNVPYVPPPLPDHEPPSCPSPCPPQSPLPEPEQLSPQSPSPECDIPEPYPDSGQQPGEWWYEHHNHVKLVIELGDDDETERQQRRREVKEKAAKEIRYQDSIGNGFKDAVYIWEPTDLHPTFLLRRRLSAAEVPRIWSSIPPSNKLYNPYDEEWDFYDASCDMDARTRKPRPDSDPREIDIEMSRVTGIRGNPKSTVNDLKTTLQGRIEDALSWRVGLFYEHDPFESALRRFGFVFPSPPFTCNAVTKVKWFYHLGYKDVMLPKDKADQIEQTLSCLQQDHTDHLHHLLDIYTNPQAIIDTNTVIIRHFPDAEFEFSSNRRRNLYILTFPGDNRQDWFLGLSQASDLVFALREGWATSREDLGEYFLLHGIQFYTLAPVPPPSEYPYFCKAPKVPSLSASQRALFPDAHFTIPLEPVSGKYTVTDFFEYEKRREQLLDMPYGRVAARSGGVVARMWRRDVSKYPQRVKQALVGPTDLALWKGIRIRCAQGLEFYDDELRDITDAYICGQYQARKVDRPGVDDWHQMSWYSTNAAFNSRNQTISSRWTQVDETIFSKSEERIYDQLTPKSTKAWKKQARSAQGLLDDWIEKHCRTFIRQYVEIKSKL